MKGGFSGTETQFKITENVNAKVLVLCIAMPDSSENIPWSKYNLRWNPGLRGTLPSGQLMRDYIAQLPDSMITIDSQYKSLVDTYWDDMSVGRVNIESVWPKENGLYTWKTLRTRQQWYSANGGSIGLWFNQATNILSEVCTKLKQSYNGLLASISAIHIVLINSTAEERTYLGQVYSSWANSYRNIIRDPNNVIIYNGPLTFNLWADAIPHEGSHILPATLDPNLTNGEHLPDRGIDRSSLIGAEDHYNLLPNYDMMYHNGGDVFDSALYGMRPMHIIDLIKLGWVKQNELEINDTSHFIHTTVKDIRKPLTANDIGSGIKRAVKINLANSEYLLADYHNNTGYDKNLGNHDEGYSRGVSFSHLIDYGNWNPLIDMLLAQPYNSWGERAPIPNDNYPRDSVRFPSYNGIYNKEYDYLDDLMVEGLYPPCVAYRLFNMPDGGRWSDVNLGADSCVFPSATADNSMDNGVETKSLILAYINLANC